MFLVEEAPSRWPQEELFVEPSKGTEEQFRADTLSAGASAGAALRAGTPADSAGRLDQSLTALADRYGVDRRRAAIDRR